MTSGLLLLTTDGAAAHRLMHPRYAVPRTYWLRAHGLGARELRAALARPPALDGRPVRVLDARVRPAGPSVEVELTDRKSTRLNSSHSQISYAVFCLKKKKNTQATPQPIDRRTREPHVALPITKIYRLRTRPPTCAAPVRPMGENYSPAERRSPERRP